MRRTIAAAVAGFTILGGALVVATVSGATPATAQEADAGEEAPATLADILGDLVDDGIITQEQADAVAEAIADRGPRHGRFGHRGMHAELIADTIGITTEDLRAELEDGQTIAEVATANGVDPASVVDVLVSEMEARLDEAVANGPSISSSPGAASSRPYPID